MVKEQAPGTRIHARTHHSHLSPFVITRSQIYVNSKYGPVDHRLRKTESEIKQTKSKFFVVHRWPSTPSPFITGLLLSPLSSLLSPSSLRSIHNTHVVSLVWKGKKQEGEREREKTKEGKKVLVVFFLSEKKKKDGQEEHEEGGEN